MIQCSSPQFKALKAEQYPQYTEGKHKLCKEVPWENCGTLVAS
jgi:hypothetical protein